MTARIIRLINGRAVEVDSGSPIPKAPPIPEALPILPRWSERKAAYEDRFTKLMYPDWINSVLSGALSPRPEEIVGFIYWTAAILYWVGCSREEILAIFMSSRFAYKDEETLSKTISDAFTAEKYGRKS